ncbi:MAG: conjugal transfer protein TraH [Caldisericum sp.]
MERRYIGKGFLVLILSVFLIIQPIFVFGAWLDSWFDNVMKSYTSPGYFEAQKRGYVNFGGLSIRLPESRDFLFNIMLPRLKVGCGGIDLFLGGVGFVNFEYLVQKIQGLIQNAPLIAFDIALSTLSPQLSAIVKAAEELVDTLNSIQISECGIYIPRGIVEKGQALWKALQGSEGSSSESLSKGQGSFFKQFFDRLVKIEGYNYGVPKSDSGADATTGVHPYVTELMNRGGGLLLDAIARKDGLDEEIVRYARGLIGDMRVNVSKEGGKPVLATFTYVDPCPDALSKFEKSEAVLSKPSGSNNCIPVSFDNIKEKITNRINSIYQKIKNKQDLTSEEQKFISSIPVSLYSFLKVGAIVKDPSIVSTASWLTYELYLIEGLSALLLKVREVFHALKKPGGICDPNASPDKYQECINNYQPANQEIGKMEMNMSKFETALMNKRIALATNFNALANMSLTILRFQELVKTNLARNFNPALAARYTLY